MDRFQICVGYWVYSMLWNSGGLTQRDKAGWPATEHTDARQRRSISQQLFDMKFVPGHIDPFKGWERPFRLNDSMGSLGAQTASDNDEWLEAFDVYLGLVEKYEGTAAAMLDCYDLQQHCYTAGSDLTIQQAIQLIDSDRLGITIYSPASESGVKAVRYDHDLICREDDGEPDFMPWIFQARQFCSKFKLVLNWQQGFVEAHVSSGAKEVEKWPIKFNSNALYAMACPCCGNKDEFHIASTAWFKVFDEGTDDCVDGPEWTADSEAFCVNCRQYGQVSDFEISKEVVKKLRGQ